MLKCGCYNTLLNNHTVFNALYKDGSNTNTVCNLISVRECLGHMLFVFILKFQF